MPAPDDGTTERLNELIGRLFSSEQRTLIQALGKQRAGSASEDDHNTIRSIFRLAQERLETGLTIIRERKTPEQWNLEVREALRLRRETGGAWRSIDGYNEFLAVAAVDASD